MTFALKLLVFLWFPSTFCPEFCFSLSEETEEETFCLADTAFFLSLFFGFSLEFLSVTIDSAYRGAVFDLEIPSYFFLHTKLSIYFSLSWETKTVFFWSLCWSEGPSKRNVQETLIFFLSLNLYFAPILLFLLFKKKLAIFF